MALLENNTESFKNVISFGNLLKSNASWTTVNSNVNEMTVCGTTGSGAVKEARYHKRYIRELLTLAELVSKSSFTLDGNR